MKGGQSFGIKTNISTADISMTRKLKLANTSKQ